MHKGLGNDTVRGMKKRTLMVVTAVAGAGLAMFGAAEAMLASISGGQSAPDFSRSDAVVDDSGYVPVRVYAFSVEGPVSDEEAGELDTSMGTSADTAIRDAISAVPGLDMRVTRKRTGRDRDRDRDKGLFILEDTKSFLNIDVPDDNEPSWGWIADGVRAEERSAAQALELRNEKTSGSSLERDIMRGGADIYGDGSSAGTRLLPWSGLLPNEGK